MFVSADALAANRSFYDAVGAALGVPPGVCADAAVEDEQSRLCWLTGPEGAFAKWPEARAGGSFVTDYISLFLLPANLSAALPALLYYRHAFARGGADGGYALDFIVHPESGCSYADHVAWPLRSGQILPLEVADRRRVCWPDPAV